MFRIVPDSGISRSRAAKGFTSSEAAGFVLSLKRPVFEMIHRTSSAVAVLSKGAVTRQKLLELLMVARRQGEGNAARNAYS